MTEQNAHAFDVVCGMELDLATITHAAEYNGETYYFCSETCKERFEQDPKKYIG